MAMTPQEREEYELRRTYTRDVNKALNIEHNPALRDLALPGIFGSFDKRISVEQCVGNLKPGIETHRQKPLYKKYEDIG
jgi:hypothetical protein